MRYLSGTALAFSLIGLPILATGTAAAQSPADFPNRPIRFVIAQTPGSSIDTMSRVVATRMSELLGQQFVIDNRTGAGGTIAASIVAHAEPNGYTLFSASVASQTIGPQIYKKTTTYDPLNSFASAGMFAVTQNVLVANPKAPFQTVKDLLAHAKANPGKINWANAGTGFQSHLASVLFTHMAKIDVLHVPYKGAGPMVSAIIAGESQVTIGPAPAWMVHVTAGRARALAMGGEKRSVLWPDLPTIIESGVPGYVSNGWAGILAPRNTPKAILDKVHATLVKAVSEPATDKALKRVGAEPTLLSPPAFSRLIEKDWKTFGDAIRISGLKVE